MFERITRLFRSNSSLSRNQGYQTPVAPIIDMGDLPSAPFDSSMGIAAVWQAVRLQAENIASLPLDFIEKTGETRTVDYSTDIAKLFQSGKINRYQDKMGFIESLMVNLLSHGNAYSLIQRNNQNRLIGLLPLSAEKMQVELLQDGSLKYHYYDDSGIQTYSEKQIWHVRLFGNGITGLSPMSMHRHSLGIAIQAQKRTGKVLGSAGKRTGILSVDTAQTSDGDLSQEQRDGLRREYNRLQQGDETFMPVLPNNISFVPLSLTPADQELLENRKFQVVEIARIFNIPPILLYSMDNSTTLGSSTAEVINSYVRLSLRPLVNKIEESIKVNFLTPAERKRIDPRFDFHELTRPMPKERAEINKINIESGVNSINEIRRRENYDPVDGLDEHLANAALKPVREIMRGQPEGKSDIQHK